MKKIIAVIVIAALVIFGAIYYKQKKAKEQFNRQFASGNGRIEATEIYIATKLAGRVEEIKVKEGELVKAGQEIVFMDTKSLKAKKEQAEAKLKIAQAQIKVEEANLKAAEATVIQRKGVLAGAQGRFNRTAQLRKTNTSTPQQFDDDKANLEAAKGSLQAAEAQVLQAKAAVESAKANVAAATADLKYIQTELDDSVLKTPRMGRIQYKISQPGEVLQAGGKVVNLADLSDVYMTFFLPELDAGQLEIGAEVRIVLDAIPDYPQPAKISFISSTAQFTPKTVETKSERQKLMFRVKAQLDPALLKEYIEMVKTGLPGVAYVKLDPNAKWPEYLEVKKD